MHQRTAVEVVLETILFRARWLLSPFYLGRVVSLLMLLASFLGELCHTLPWLLKLPVYWVPPTETTCGESEGKPLETP